MVESALVFLVFMCMFIGIADFGQFLYFHQALVDRARAGVRYAAVNPSATITQIQNATVYNDPAATSASSPIVSGLAPSMITAYRSGTAGTEDGTVTVKISGFPFSYLSPWIAGRYTNAPIVATLPDETP